MDAPRFGSFARTLTAAPSRRTVLGLTLGGSLVGLMTRLGWGDAMAKKGRKKRLKRNSYGCVGVGGACRGNSANCCSGICEGKKPKQGKKDKSRCVAHDASTCQAGDNGEICGGLENVSCTTSAGDPGLCHTTTGNAGHCPSSLQCAECQRDADCEEIFGLGAACLLCGGCAQGTICGGLGTM